VHHAAVTHFVVTHENKYGDKLEYQVIFSQWQCWWHFKLCLQQKYSCKLLA